MASSGQDLKEYGLHAGVIDVTGDGNANDTPRAVPFRSKLLGVIFREQAGTALDNPQSADILKNGSDSNVDVQFPAAASGFAIMLGRVDFEAGDQISLRMNAAGTTTGGNTDITWILEQCIAACSDDEIRRDLVGRAFDCVLPHRRQQRDCGGDRHGRQPKCHSADVRQCAWLHPFCGL